MAIPKLQLLEEEADDSPAAQVWDKSLPKKVLELAARMVTVAQAHSEWHRRMTSEKLNQANRPFDDSQLSWCSLSWSYDCDSDSAQAPA
jgi:hypothetical protein